MTQGLPCQVMRLCSKLAIHVPKTGIFLSESLRIILCLVRFPTRMR